MLPLSFSEYVRVLEGLDVSTGSIDKIEENAAKNKMYGENLRIAFQKYLQTGGFPLSIIDFYSDGKVSFSTLKTYLDWLRGDWLKAGKNEKYMKEIISYLIRARGIPVSWNGIASETGINSPNTARSYVEVLEATFATKIIYFFRIESIIKRIKKSTFQILFYIMYSLIMLTRKSANTGWWKVWHHRLFQENVRYITGGIQQRWIYSAI